MCKTKDEYEKPNDGVRDGEDAHPVGDEFGMNVYEAIHIKTNQKVYVTVDELI